MYTWGWCISCHFLQDIYWLEHHFGMKCWCLFSKGVLLLASLVSSTIPHAVGLVGSSEGVPTFSELVTVRCVSFLTCLPEPCLFWTGAYHERSTQSACSFASCVAAAHLLCPVMHPSSMCGSGEELVRVCAAPAGVPSLPCPLQRRCSHRFVWLLFAAPSKRVGGSNVMGIVGLVQSTCSCSCLVWGCLVLLLLCHLYQHSL